MKSLNQIFKVAFFLALGLMVGASNPPVAGKKFALIIAVGDYPRTGGWMDLSSGRDADVLASTLYQLQFNPILMLKDAAATHQGIINAIDNQIIPQVTPGDVVFIHFSGHGQQISEELTPPSMAKDEFDGLDEALIPYDANDSFQYGVYEGQNHLSDDKIQELLTKARQRLGPSGQLVLSVDACYSGTINRDAGLVRTRGTRKVFSPTEISSTQAGGQGGGLLETEIEKETGLAPLIVISASRADEPNYEAVDESGQSIGSLSLALSRSFSRLKPSMSFEAFFRQLKSEMKQLAPNQTPQIEGDITQQVFGPAKLPLLGLQVLRFDNASTAVLQAGTLADLHPGSKVKLEPISGNGSPIMGTVAQSSLTESTITLNGQTSDRNAGNWKVTVTEKVSLAVPVRVALQVNDANLSQAIQTEFGKQQRLQITGAGAELTINQASPGGTIQLVNNAQQPIQQWRTQGSSPEAVAAALTKRIQEYARAKYLRNLQTDQGTVQGLNIQVVPVQVETYNSRVRVKSQGSPIASTLVDYPTLRIGSYFIMKVTNTTSTELYFSIVGVSSDDAAYVMVPDERANSDEFRIKPGEEMVLSRGEYLFEVAEPRGLDTYLAIGSPKPLDFRTVLNPTRSSSSPQEQEFAEILFGNTRAFVQPGQLAVGSVTVKIQ